MSFPFLSTPNFCSIPTSYSLHFQEIFHYSYSALKPIRKICKGVQKKQAQQYWGTFKNDDTADLLETKTVGGPSLA